MVDVRYTDKIIRFCIVLNLYFCMAFQGEIEESNRDNGYKLATLPNSHESEEKWLENALKDIAYYLRNYKFNEWDRRHFKVKPPQYVMGFYKNFPIPSMKSHHWEVHKHCYEDFLRCIKYLHNIIESAPFTRIDDVTTSIIKHSLLINTTSMPSRNEECLKALSYTEKTGLPFSGPLEKFNWCTSASYYMCWYTMKGVPALSMLGESCDNFAHCLDNTFGYKNLDPRSDDRLSFACAMYSFCPDPCCPLKHIYTLTECHDSKINPCYVGNVQSKSFLHRRCRINRNENQNLENLMKNHWNVSCYCPQKGFRWDTRFGMCVDINECTSKLHKCNLNTEDCLNLPGSYKCVCKWGYVYHKIKKKCIENDFLIDLSEVKRNSDFDINVVLTTLLDLILL